MDKMTAQQILDESNNGIADKDTADVLADSIFNATSKLTEMGAPALFMTFIGRKLYGCVGGLDKGVRLLLQSNMKKDEQLAEIVALSVVDEAFADPMGEVSAAITAGVIEMAEKNPLYRKALLESLGTPDKDAGQN